mmetsp:Transcript_13140/g.15918  ORF Transcript_13140/g.15918 Transcript_13140/m.15918 type:complete len:243 (+) Transcript_13140:745-1473(+)
MLSGICLGLHIRVLHLVDANHTVGCCECFLIVLQLNLRVTDTVAVELVQQPLLGLPGHSALVIDRHVVTGLNIVEHRARDLCQVRHLSDVISVLSNETSGPHKDVVCQMLHDLVSNFLLRDQGLSKKCNVFVVPGVSVCNGGTVGNTINLVAIVPPSHHTGILWGVVPQPPICFTEVIQHHNLTSLHVSPGNDLRFRHMRGHHVSMVPVGKDSVNAEEDHYSGHCLDKDAHFMRDDWATASK